MRNLDISTFISYEFKDKRILLQEVKLLLDEYIDMLEALEYYEDVENKLKTLQRRLDNDYIDADEFGEAVYDIIETYF